MTFLVMLWSIIMMSLFALYQTVWLQNSLQLIYTVSGGAQADHNLETSHTKLTANKRQMCHIQVLCHLSFIMSRVSFSIFIEFKKHFNATLRKRIRPERCHFTNHSRHEC